MATWHISADLFRRFLARSVGKEDSKRILRHLIRGCAECGELAARIVEEAGYWFPKRDAGFTAEECEAAFTSALRFGNEKQRRAAVERVRGWGQWSSIEPLLPEERLAQVIRDRQFHHWGFHEALLDASRWYSRNDPLEAVNIVRLAVSQAEILDAAAVGGARAAADLRARGFAILGNALRLAADLAGARQAIDEAWRLHGEGTGDLLQKAQLTGFDASLIRAMGEFETAEAALEEALEIYQAAGDHHMQGRTLLKMGNAIGYANPARGIEHICRALALINTAKEPRLELCAQHDLAWFMTDAGRPEQALAILDRARPLYKQFPDPWTQLRLHWLEGRIARGLGHLEEASSTLGQLWERFQAHDLKQELVILSIDLAEIHVARGEFAAGARLAADIYPIMVQRGLHRPALAAWLVFQQALERGQAARLCARLRLYYRRHWLVGAEFPSEKP